MNNRDDATSKDLEALRLELRKLQDDIVSMGNTLKNLAGDVGHSAQEKIREATDRARLRAEKAADTVTHRIEDQPLVSVLIAFVIGLVLGVVFGRQR